MMKKKEKERRSKKWAGLAHQAAHVPVPLQAWLIPNPPPLLLSFSTLHHSFRLVSLSAAPPLSFSGCAPLLPSLRRCSAPLPRYSPSRSTAAAVPFQIEHMVAEWSRGRRGGGGIDEETAESREHQLEHKATRRRLTPKASLERPDA